MAGKNVYIISVEGFQDSVHYFRVAVNKTSKIWQESAGGICVENFGKSSGKFWKFLG